MGSNTSKYTFTIKDEQELSDALMERVVDFQNYVIITGKATSWQKNKDYYENKFYTSYEGLDIIDAGEQGELLAMSVNHFRNVIRHTLNPIQSVTPSFTVTSVNSDVNARRGADIGKQIINYYEKVKRFSKVSKRVAEYAVVYGDGYHVEEWNPLCGEKNIDPETGKLEPDGDFDAEAISVWDMFFDFTKKGTRDWFIFRRRKNKFDVAASFSGEKKEKILHLDPFYMGDRYFKDMSMYGSLGNTDEIYVYSCYHRATEAVKGGLYCMFAGDGTKTVNLYTSENIYENELPIFVMQPAQFLENEFGFTDTNTFRGCQEMINDVISKSVTNAQSALKDIWFPKGEECNIEALSSGRNIIQSSVKPEVIDLYAGDNGLINLFNMFKGQMETLSAQNAVVRGDIASAPNLKSGIAIQTVVAMGQQFSYGLQSSYNELFEDINTFRLKTLQKFPKNKRVIDIIGKSQSAGTLAFTASDLKGVSRVVVNLINPMLNSPAGRIEIAESLLKNQMPGFGMIEYFDVVNYGNLDAATESQKALITYVAQVKEMLLAGKPVTPVAGADHKYVVKEVQALLMNPEFTQDQNNAPIVQAITQFITAEMEIMHNGDEISAMIYGGMPPTYISPMPQGVPQGNMPPSGNIPQPTPEGRRPV